jgi:hypothetical protein
MGGESSTYEKKGTVYIGFCWGNLRAKPLGRPRLRWENNIKVDLQEVGCAGMDCIDLA